MSEERAREELLRRLEENMVEIGSDEASHLVADDPELMAELSALREMERALGAAGDDQREVVQSLSIAPDQRAQAGEILARVWSEPAPAATPRGIRPAVWIARIAAVAALVAIGAALQRSADHPEPPPIQRMGQKLELLEPPAVIDAIERFAWRQDLPSGGWYELTVRSESRTVIDHLRLAEPWYVPTAEQKAAFGSVVRWTVSAYAPGFQTPIATAHGESRQE